MKKAGGIFKLGGICAVILATIYMSYYGYAKRLNDYADHSAFETLAETARQQQYNVSNGLNSDKRALLNLALIWGMGTDYVENGYHLELLRSNTHFDSLDFFDTAGQHIWGNDPSLRLPSDPAPAPGPSLETVSCSLIREERNAILMAVPVYNSRGLRTGTLTGTHSIQALSHALLPFFEGGGNTYLFSGNWELISASGQSEEDTLWENYRSAARVSGDTLSQVRNNMVLGKSGNTVIEIDGTKQYIYYRPAGINDWYLATTISENEVSDRTDLAMRSALGVSAAVMFAFTLIVLYILWQQRRHDKALRRAAFYDEFCDCPNLTSFRLSAQKLMDDHPDWLMIMVKVDIDRFKLVNQTLSIETGDRILKNMAAALRQNVNGDERCFARAHDDTFYVLHLYKDQEDLKARKHSFLDNFTSLMGKDFHYKIIFISGVYYASLDHCKSAAEAIEKANIAHRRAKDTGQRLCSYDENLVRQALRKRDIEERMEDALKQEEFRVYLQAQNSLHTGAIIAAEALVRWQIGDEALSPDEFIPIFEENNFILQLDLYIFEKVCGNIREWMDAGLTPVGVSVNFARNHLGDPAFSSKLRDIADRHMVPRHLLEVELTERVIAQDESVSLQFLEELHESGFTVSMDDFGTGYSSLGLLKNIPVDVIKLDKSFFDRADDQPRTQAVLSNVIHLAKDLNALTIAEGVETKDVADMLCAFGCDAAQGYYFYRPVPEPQFRKLLSSNSDVDHPAHYETGTNGLGGNAL